MATHVNALAVMAKALGSEPSKDSEGFFSKPLITKSVVLKLEEGLAIAT
jgi:hypothetical protein